MADRLAERVRTRLKEEKKNLGLSERDLAGVLKWSQSKVTQKLQGRTPITMDELEAFCFALSIQPSEVVRDRGYEFVAEMTPSELRLLQRLREMPKTVMDGILSLLHLPHATASDERPKKPAIPRGGRR